MARIALRAYNREIEHLIEGGQIEEAIAHCRHIFKYFPKHINTYRLLGKAYLETQRYGDAADILQRVLSSIPDDFISHLGMSIIREDEGNLDEAIWHMERAFEVQPANRAIQDELRRLYGRRDGLEPPKIRLTRGALARMYAKGDLYPQAIAELRAALAEDPQRLDLQVVLADVYARAGQRVEAASICNGLLRKLPYCLVANQVMADILADSERSEEARVYRQRAQALDAYLAHTSPGAPTPEKVPDIAVSLERLVWQPGKSIEGAGQPDWVASLGVELESGASQKEEIPDWLSAVQADAGQAVLPSDTETNVPFTEDAGAGADWMEDSAEAPEEEWMQGRPSDTAQPSTEAEIPEWMKAAGWSPTAGEVEEQPVEFDFEDENFAVSQPESGIEDANLPDWLKEIAPENLEQDVTTGFEESGWDQGLSEDEAILENVPDWFGESEIKETEEDESPDWLAGLAGEPAAEPEVEVSAESTEELPDWLRETNLEEDITPTAEIEAEPADEIPDWLIEMDAEAGETVTSEGEIELEPAEELPDWLKETETAEEATPTDEAEAEPAEGVPDWLEEIEAEAGETIVSMPEAEIELEPAEELPDWLKETETAEEATPTDEAEAEPVEAVPDWLEEIEAEAGETVVSAPEAEIELEPEEELPDWLEVSALEQVQPETAIEEEAISIDEEAAVQSDVEIEPGMEIEAQALVDEGMTVVSPSEGAPEEALDRDESGMLAQGEQAIETEDQGVSPVSSQAEELPQATLPSGELDSEAAFAWLESLAAKQGADEEGLLLTPEERVETPPDWVKSAMEAEAESTEPAGADFEMASEEGSQPEDVSASLESTIEAEAFPDWLQEIEETSEQEGGPAEEPMPDWLQQAGETYQEEFGQTEEEAQAAEDIPEWLKTMQFEHEEQQPEAEAVEELPDWLRGMPEDAEEEPATEAPQDLLASLEEPIIEGDTKPTRIALEAQEEQTITPESGPVQATERSEIGEESRVPETGEPEIDKQIEEPLAEDTPLDEDAGFAWLESLAARQGIDEGMLLAPEERLEKPPEWIQSALDKQFGERPQESVEELAEYEEEQALITAAEDQVVEEPDQSKEAPELPDWLVDIEAEAGTDEAIESIEAISESGTAAEEEIPELPTWLETAEEKEEPVWTPPEPVSQKIDLNQASLAELERLPGIGFIMAQQIVTYREQNGPFSDLSELARIPGFDTAMLDGIEDLIMVESVQAEPIDLPVEAGTPQELIEARQVMLTGSLDGALEKYSELILQKKSLNEVIYDLNQILLRHEGDADVWQTLGDAQMRANLVQEALESYMRAEQLFR